MSKASIRPIRRAALDIDHESAPGLTSCARARTVRRVLDDAKGVDEIELARLERDPMEIGLNREERGVPALVVLALHLLHHPADSRRLIWLRDLIELGDPASAAEARTLADRLGVRWALERALWGAERLLGEARWGAVSPSGNRGGLVEVLELGDAGHLYQLARAWDLGLTEGMRYLLSRLDPRRFTGGETGSRWGDASAWLRKHLAQALTTPWSRSLHRG